MTKSILSLVAILIPSLTAIIQVTTSIELVRPSANDFQSLWHPNSQHNQNSLLKKWFSGKRIGNSAESATFDNLRPGHHKKGCTDPSEPFQCPQSDRCVALQFICDGHPGDCPYNLDENEETCIAAQRPAKENIEKYLQSEYTLHGLELFKFLFGENISKNIEKNHMLWLDKLASAFSVSKTIRRFAEKLHMSSDDLAHFRNVIQLIHDGYLEEIPLFAQEAVNQGLASLIEKLYQTGFME